MSDSISQTNDDTPSLKRRVRLVILLHAAEKAGLVPMHILQLHTLAYLSNVLAPVWDMPALDGKVLKRHGGPFYPNLQRDLDRLVGAGVVLISKLGHVLDEDQRWRLEGMYRLNRIFADRIVNCLANFEEEQHVANFLQELAFALSVLGTEDLDQAMKEDATYADPLVDIGSVVDFAEWQHRNYSENAARYFDQVLPHGLRTTPGEKLHLYVRHLHARMHRGR